MCSEDLLNQRSLSEEMVLSLKYKGRDMRKVIYYGISLVEAQCEMPLL